MSNNKRPYYSSKRARKAWLKDREFIEDGRTVKIKIFTCENPSCNFSGRFDEFDIHHTIPRSVLGKEYWYDPKYLILLCRHKCHARGHSYERWAYSKKRKGAKK